MVAALPDPPPVLPADPPTWEWPPSKRMVRIYHEHPTRNGLAPRTFGPLNRFDPHVRDRNQRPREDPSGRGVLYLADALETAAAEVFSGQWPQVGICARMRAGWLAPASPTDLLDLTRAGALNIGAVGTLAWGNEPRRRTQRWGRRVHEQYTHLVGITYAGAHEGGRCVAVWERARLTGPGPGADLALWTICTRLIDALATQRRQPRRLSASECVSCRAVGYSS